MLQREAIARGSGDVEAEVQLSDREREVLLALEQGQRLIDVAKSLVVSEKPSRHICAESTKSLVSTTGMMPFQEQG